MSSNFTGKLKAWMAAEGLTVSGVAALLAVDHSTVHRWTKGQIPKGTSRKELGMLMQGTPSVTTPTGLIRAVANPDNWLPTTEQGLLWCGPDIKTAAENMIASV